MMDESHLPPVSPKPEQNLFNQVRVWTDVFPWLRLVRVLRIAGAPVWMLHTLLVFLVWMAVLLNFRAEFVTQAAWGSSWNWTDWAITISPGDVLVRPTGWFERSSLPESQTIDWFIVFWTSLIWLPTSMMLIRTGALLAAGHDMPSFLSTARYIGCRLRSGLIVILLPLLVALPFWGIVWTGTMLPQWIGAEGWIDWVLQWGCVVLVVPALITASLLLIAGKVAAPLALASLMTAKNADPMDSLSRGYEYTLRRLPQLILFALIALALSIVVVAAWTLVGVSGLQFVASQSGIRPLVTAIVMGWLSAIAIMMFWSMVGGVYLLLRQSAGGQEIEDIDADFDGVKVPKMPSVRKKDAQI